MTLKTALVLPCVAMCACGARAVRSQTTADPPAVTEEIARQAAVADSTRSAYTQADIDFMVGMIHHHAQALTMSRMAPDHDASGPMRILTARIINAQRDEIRLMQQWLRERGQRVPDPPEMHAGEMGGGDDGAMDAGHAAHDAMPAGEGGAHAMHMPGMLTPAQLEALDEARGEDWDRLFLQFMIQHHEGALTMVDELFATPGAAQEDAVFKLASDIGADQTSEIERMRTMLAELLVAGGG
jgi:uncharacterized protein (DUF305 family)